MQQHQQFDFSAEAISLNARRYVHETGRRAQYAELAGESTVPVYKARLAEIGRAIAALKRAHADLSELQAHAHEWNDDGFCSICGADGNA